MYTGPPQPIVHPHGHQAVGPPESSESRLCGGELDDLPGWLTACGGEGLPASRWEGCVGRYLS